MFAKNLPELSELDFFAVKVHSGVLLACGTYCVNTLQILKKIKIWYRKEALSTHQQA